VDIGDIYQDTENMASILLQRDTNGKVHVVSGHSFLTFLSSPPYYCGSSFVNQRDSLRTCVIIIAISQFAVPHGVTFLQQWT